ncbi:MAG: PQQ-binding-like beta-propeller repeat protein [Thermoanaerobaculia bacterium]
MSGEVEPSARLELGLIAAGAAVFAVILLFPPSRGRTLVALLLPMATLAGVSVRWFRSDSPSRRTKTISLGLAVAAALFLIFGSTFPAVIFAVLWGLPASMALALLALSLTKGRAVGTTRLAVGGVFLASLVPWPFLRADGASGQMMPNFLWVWDAPTGVVPEEHDAPGTLAVAVPTVVTVGDWPEFRGPQRDGVVPGEVVAGLDLEWGARPPAESWRRAIGRGWSSFAVVGDLACTQDQVGELERVVCLDAPTGRTVWVHSEETRFEEIAGGAGPRATPLIHDGRLYALGATGRLNCLAAQTGKRIWSADISGGDGAAPEWGFASSPLIHDELVYVSPAGANGIRMLALDRRSGERVWQGVGEYQGYSSAQLAVLGGTPQLLLFDGGGLVSYEPRTGEELWSYDWSSEPPRVAQPHVATGDTVIIGMGYGRGTRSLHVSRRHESWFVKERWATSRFKPKFNDFVIRAGHIFGLDEGILVCIDALSGERLWKGGRYGYGQLLLLGEVLLIVTESGDLVLVEASTSGHNELARIQALTGKTWAHPALARGRLFVRNGNETASYDLGVGAGP